VTTFRVMTYNVHRCIGRFGRDSTADIGATIAAARPDLVALQELDAPETDETEGAHHARDLARGLGMTLLFCRTFRRGVGFYGHALLSKTSLELMRVTTFPTIHESSEPRGAIWAQTSIAGERLDIVSTHLGLSRRERKMQSTVLLGPEWLGSAEMGKHRVLCGDLNAVQHARTYSHFAATMNDAQRVLPGHRPRPTFPSVLPLVRIDHVFVTPEIAVRGVTVAHDARARRASDHLPLIVDLEMT
jgi:endonuclease/exonuclease/phosphatase family metal-dependent hydrolase